MRSKQRNSSGKHGLAFLLMTALYWNAAGVVAAEKKMRPRKPVDTAASILEGLNGACPQTCTGDLIPGPRARRRPYANGCTIPKFDQKSAFYGDHSHFDKCCNYHDVCYMTCGSPRNKCDEEFKQCLHTSCERSWDLEHCNKMANMFHLQQKLYGCQEYRASQMELCNCWPKEEAHERAKTYAYEFFQAYNQTHMPDQLIEKYFDKEPDPEVYGDLIYRLYKRYPEGVEIVGRDGIAKRSGPVYFDFGEQEDKDDNDEL